MVADAFVLKPESDEELVVNHIDEDPLNNYYRNLEWITQKQNLNHGTVQIRKSTWVRGYYKGKIVYDIPVLSQSSEVGLNRRRIGEYLNHKRPYKNIEWIEVTGKEKDQLIKERTDYSPCAYQYVEELEPTPIPEKVEKKLKRFDTPQIVVGFDKDGNEVLRFESINQAIKNGYTQYGLYRSSVLNIEYEGLYWKFFETYFSHDDT